MACQVANVEGMQERGSRSHGERAMAQDLPGEYSEARTTRTRRRAGQMRPLARTRLPRLSANDPQVAGNRRPRFLTEPAELANLQIRHGDDEHALCLANLRNPLSAEGTRRIGPRLRVSFQSLIVRVASIIGNDPQCRISRD